VPNDRAYRLDYSAHPVRAVDCDCPDSWPCGSASALTDGLGAERYPAAWRVWTRPDAPTSGRPASVLLDYGEPVEVGALVHYFYVPGSRDHRWRDYLCGPAAFGEVRIHAGDDGEHWRVVAHLTDLPPECPQVLPIAPPVRARYLKLEVVSMAAGAPGIRSYELDTYIGGVPGELVVPEGYRTVRRGFPCARALEAICETRSVEPFRVQIRVDGQAVVDEGECGRKAAAFKAEVEGFPIEADLRPVRAGFLVEVRWGGPVRPPFRRLDVMAAMSSDPKEWCVPGYHYGRTRPEPLSIASAVVGTCASIVSDGERALAIVPDTDASWVGLDGEYVTAAFPLDTQVHRALIVPARGDWSSAFRKVAADVFGFEEPRQFSPVSKAVPDLCRFVLRPELWSEKYRMIRSFPDTDFFYIFYSLPYAVPALTIWEVMSGDASVREKIDCILRFALDRRLRDGLMAGALFSEYADRELVETGRVPFGYAPFYDWHVNYPNEQLVGMDQGCNRWITAHNMGAVLWTITYVWGSRGGLPPDILEGAKDVADWMVRMQEDDGSWHYAYHEDGSVASPCSDSGTIWNVWSLWRFGRMTGESKYLEAADKARAYFKRTFTANHLYRGYWEDIYGGGKTELNTAQGYESAIATQAFAEMGDAEAAVSSAQDALRFVCTRVLESRDYWTSYGGVAEQQNWAPGTYIAPTFGYAAHIAWRISGDDFFRPFASLAKTIGWWQDDSSGGAFWMSAAVTQQPIEMLREANGDRQFWALWDSAQKVAFTVPWLVDEVNRRTGDRVKLDATALIGTDDRGTEVRAAVFDGEVESDSGQVNWLALKPSQADGETGLQLVLINHAEATECRVRVASHAAPAAARAFDSNGEPTQARFAARAGEAVVALPERHTVILVWPALPQ